MNPQQVGPISDSFCEECSTPGAPERGCGRWWCSGAGQEAQCLCSLPRQRVTTALLSYNKCCFWLNSEQFPFKRIPFKKNNNPFFLRPERQQKKLVLFSCFSCETVSGGTIWFLFLQFFCVLPFVSKNEHIQAWEKEVKSDCIAFLCHIRCNARLFFFS